MPHDEPQLAQLATLAAAIVASIIASELMP